MEVGGKDEPTSATWVFRAPTLKWETVHARGGPPGGQNSRLVWATGPQLLIYWSPRDSTLWAFDPRELAWEKLTPKGGPAPSGFYRQGMAYDSANDALVLYGGYEKPEGAHGPWVYSFAARTWKEMKPTGGPPNGYGQQMMMDYDSEYNVVVIACNQRGTWAYRTARARK